ncbi:flagellar brake protein [Caballeronia ptereochthonis]|uniref:Type IV pilus assembly protein PilZ n=1 Tax=Caballeronia ptereochthonis TaxID=1777144 RepID=A0A157ZNM5_9BURK|nr:flagellar brake protein [Caballeronia ptereochthonis]SAK47112.1 type IV pilus assembly protein PilZ [Caballeronia ptereochthonis]
MTEETVLEARRSLVRLNASDIPLNASLEWPIVAADGALLFDAGDAIQDAAARDFMFRHFEPHRVVREPAPNVPRNEADEERPPTFEDIGLSIGARVGLRGTGGTGSAMYASRVIGFSAPRRNGERSLFVTQPLMAGFDPLELAIGEQVDLVALTGRGVFRFACTVDATCREPFNYVVLSAPGAIRKLRTRKFARMPTRLAAHFSADGKEGAVRQLGRVSDISPYGMSLTVAQPSARVGDRLNLSFQFSTDGVDVRIDTIAIVRHVGTPDSADHSAAYGLEFESLEPSQRIALKSFMAEQS